jgi:hypothetical protein
VLRRASEGAGADAGTADDDRTAAAQAPAQPAAPATPAAGSESTRSLFAPTPREFLIGGRFSSVDGDQARFQRYQDMRDGLYFQARATHRRAGRRLGVPRARR